MFCEGLVFWSFTSIPPGVVKVSQLPPSLLGSNVILKIMNILSTDCRAIKQLQYHHYAVSLDCKQ